MHSRFRTDVAVKAALITQEAIGNPQQIADHALARIEWVRHGHTGDAERDEGVNPEFNCDIVATGGGSGDTTLYVVGAGTATADERSRATGRGVQTGTRRPAGAGAGGTDAAFDVGGVVGATAAHGEAWHDKSEPHAISR